MKTKKNPNREKWEQNYRVIQRLSQLNEFNDLLNITFEEMLNEFLNSDEYQLLLEKLEEKQERKNGNGGLYAKCFNSVAFAYANYFNEGTAYRKKN